MLAGAVTLLLVSCPWTSGTDFDDYAGVNLIAGQNFGAADAATGEPWFLTPGLTAATNSDGSGGSGVDYARFERTSGTGAYAPPPDAPGAPVYRLEVVNLFRNGDFEDETFFENQWSEVVAGPSATSFNTTSQIEGTRSLNVQTGDPDDRVEVDLAHPDYGLLGGFREDTLFAFHIDFRIAGSSFTMGLHDGTTNAVSGPWTIVRGSPSEITVFSFPGSGAQDPADQPISNAIYRQGSRTRLSFGGVDADSRRVVNGTFDRLRVVQADRGHYARLPVPYRAAGRPDLMSGGTYTFSIYVAPDPSATDGSAPNRFPARFFSAGLQRNPPLGGVDAEEVLVRTFEGWERVEFQFSGSGLRLDSAGGSDAVLEILLEVGASHLGTTYTDSGSLLVAAPSLTWTP
ncbi:MAG: hypothetical protein EA427_13380 [Spirochaetaceae bacterium]|nr:MAG: hypothetical protein EA427_13380 [Spirochaetaceae bacterium]